MSSSLRERFGRLERIPGRGLASSGSSAVLALKPASGLADLKTIFAIQVLVHRGLGLMKAKRAIEELVETGRTVVRLPMVESVAALATELAASGVSASSLESTDIGVKEVREGLGLTQEQFALNYGIDLRSLQNWESGRRKPDTATRSYMKVIARLPRDASEALEDALQG